MSSTEVIEALCRIIEICLEAIEDESVQREISKAYKETMGEE